MNEKYNIDFKSLSNEELDAITNQMKDLFNRILNKLNEIKAHVENLTKGGPAITNLKITPKAKLLFIAKRIGLNALASFFTGIDPYFFDNDLSEINDKSYEYYLKMDKMKLGYSATLDCIEGVKKTIELLDSDKRIETLEAINEHLRYLDSHNVNLNNLTDYAKCLNMIFRYNLKIFDERFTYKFIALSERGYDIGMDLNYVDEIDKIYENYYQKTNSMNSR